MKQVKMYCIVYTDATNKDSTANICAEDILEAANIAVRLTGVSATNIKQIQKCKAEPYIELKEE